MHPPPVTIRPRLSVIVSAGSSDWVPAGLLAQLCSLPLDVEIVLAHARKRALQTPPGWPPERSLRQCAAEPELASQMNAGARIAGGEWLWFLPADTRLTASAVAAAYRLIGRREPVLGWFDLQYIGSHSPMLPLLASAANLWARLTRRPPLPQGYCLPAAQFEALGAFPEQPFTALHKSFIRAARATGLAVRRTGGVLQTSAVPLRPWLGAKTRLTAPVRSAARRSDDPPLQ